MRITDLKAHLVPLDLRTQYREDVAPLRWDCVVVEIESDEGVTGWAQPHYLGNGRSLAETLAGFVKPLIVGEDPRYPERIWQKVWAADRIGFMSMLAHGGVDVAIWDLNARLADRPLYHLLGASREKVRAYASTTTLGSVEEYVELAEAMTRRGFTAIKLHCWGDPDRDIEACEAVRATVGSSVDLMLDAVGTYNHDQAIRVGRAIERLDFHWYEEPLQHNDLYGYQDLVRRLDVPIAGCELLGGGLYDYPAWISSRAIDIIRPGAGFMRGITPQRKAAALCEAFGMRCEPPTYGFPLMQVANLHVICSISNCEFFEYPVPMEMLNQLTTSVLELDEDGYVTVPRGPGLGLSIDKDELADRTQAVFN